MSDMTPEQVAAGLTKAQSDYVLSASPCVWQPPYCIKCHRTGYRNWGCVPKALAGKGIVDRGEPLSASLHSPCASILTPLGLQVREILKSQEAQP